MSAIDELAANQTSTPDPISAAEQLAVIWTLNEVNVQVRAARIFGRGSRAPVEIDLSNQDTMTFDSIRDMTRPANLVAEIVACTGAVPKKLTQAQAVQSVALVRTLAEHQQAMTDNEVAADWGASYLQAADTLDTDLNNQHQRWAAFEHLHRHDPLARARQDDIALATAGLVLRHVDGSRLVRAGWFCQYVRTIDTGINQTALAARMARVGWTRRGGTGRIKATAPSRNETLGWNFWTIPASWEDHR